MRELLGVLVVIAIIAIIWYLRKQSAQAAEQRKVDEFRRLQTSAAEADRAEQASLAATAAPAPVDEPTPAERGRGFLETAADTASGERYERATEEMEAMSAELDRAMQDADGAAQRLTGRADEAIASIQTAAAAHGGAVPGDGSHDCPSSYPIKGNLPSLRYHLPGQPSYGRTIPEVCFQNAAAAEAAGFAEAGDESGMHGGVVVEEVVVEAIAASDAGGVPPGAVRGDGSRDCPPTYPIKGNQSSLLIHVPGSPTYESTIPEFCFSSVESAQAAGFSTTRF